MAKGSLTLTERKEIESHVVHTANFLRISRGQTSSRVFLILQDATMKSSMALATPTDWLPAIPLQSRIMTICIFTTPNRDRSSLQKSSTG